MQSALVTVLLVLEMPLYVVTDASGIATFEGDLSGTVNSSVTAAVEALDEAVITKSDGALFTLAGGAEYLFIRGGSSGTSDDYVLSFNGMSASMISDAGSAFTVTFSEPTADPLAASLFNRPSSRAVFFCLVHAS